MSRPTDEIRQLQSLVYSRDGSATQADRDRLAELQGALDDGDVITNAEIDPASEPFEQDDASREAVPFFRTGRFAAVAVGASLVVGLAGGVAGGLAIAAAAPSEPLVGIVPPDSSMFSAESVTYYGELDGIRVWTGDRPAESDTCLIAQAPDGSGGTNCAGPWPKTLAVDMPVQVAGKVRSISIDLTDDNPRPILSTRRG